MFFPQQYFIPEMSLIGDHHASRLFQVYGPVPSLAGYPPFHTRACEIYHMGPLASATQAAFHGALSRFFRTEQRFGR